jgi:stage II sporulation protein D
LKKVRLFFLLPLVLCSCTSVSIHQVRQESQAFLPSEKPPSEKRGILIRVVLARDQKALRVSAAGGLLLIDTSNGEVAGRLGARHHAHLEVRRGAFYLDGRRLTARDLRLSPLEEGQPVLVAGRRYRGVLSLSRGGRSHLYLINTVGLEDYLGGVLPSEIPSSWPAAALEAQAVAARSYALFRMEGRDHPDFDLDDSTSSQVYGGREAEEARALQAVAATRGQVLAWHGKVAQAFFHSNCGGHTADASHVWNLAIPYLHGVTCRYCAAGPHRRWEGVISLEEAGRRLRAAGLMQGELEDIHPQGLDGSSRWDQVLLRTSAGNVKVRSSSFRDALGPDLLRSTHFEATRLGSRLHFEGRGWGHGLGLCQEGAREMAAEGVSWRGILSYYYPGTKISKVE